MIEVWKDIEEFNGWYQVSSIGRIKRIHPYSNQFKQWNSGERILTPRNHTNGYLQTLLCVENKYYYRYIHRLVAKCLCDNKFPDKFKEVNHIDGDKHNNVYTNLQWCDRSLNNKHAYDNKLRVVSGCYGVKRMVAQIDPSTNIVINIYESCKSAAESVGSRSSNISAACSYAESHSYRNPVNTVKGYKWRYAKYLKIGDVNVD